MTSPREARRRFRELFDRGEPFEAHEALEASWRETGSEVDRALIQLAAAFVHLERGRYAAASRVLDRALEKLRRAPERVEGIDIAALRERLAALRGRLAALEGGSADLEAERRLLDLGSVLDSAG